MRVFGHLRPFVKVVLNDFKGSKWVKYDPKSLKIVNCARKTKKEWQFQAKKDLSAKLANSNIDNSSLLVSTSVENLLATAFYLEMRRRPKTLKLFGYFLKRYKSSLRPYSLSKSFVLLCKARTAFASAAFLVFYSLAKALIPNGMC